MRDLPPRSHRGRGGRKTGQEKGYIGEAHKEGRACDTGQGCFSERVGVGVKGRMCLAALSLRSSASITQVMCLSEMTKSSRPG